MKNYKCRTIPHKDYDKELNMWVPTEPEYRIDINYNGEVYMTFSDEELMRDICTALNEGKIELHDGRKYKVVEDTGW